MEKELYIIRNTRANFLNLLSNLSLDSVNETPYKFNNNILWNLGHIIASQQILCYKLSNLPFTVEEEIILKYRKGTKPEIFIDNNEMNKLKDHLTFTIETLSSDIEKGIFKEYNPFVTSFGLELNSIEDAIKFVAVHDGMHLGYAMALKNLVKQ